MSLRVEDFAYDKITSVQYKTGLAFGTITIFASGNKAEIKHVTKGRTRVFGDYVRARITGPASHASHQPPAAPPATEEDPVDKLERLAKLREQGALTDEEFDEQKRRLLGSSTTQRRRQRR